MHICRTMNLFRFIFISSCYLFLCVVSIAQQTKTDSLLRALTESGHDTITLQLYLELGMEYENKKPAESISYYKRALGLAVKNKDTFNEMQALSNMGYVYKNSLAHYDSAEVCYSRTVEIAQERLGTRHADYATALNNLASLNETRGNYTKAEKMFLEVLDTRRILYGEKSTAYANSINNLASLYNHMGRYDEAEKYFLKSAEIWKTTVPETDRRLGNAINNLGVFYKTTGNYTEAEKYYNEAIVLKERVLGAKHPEYAMALSNMAGLYFVTGNYPAAAQFYSLAKQIIKEVQGERHPDFALVMNNMATLYSRMGNFPLAEQYYTEAIQIYKDLFGKSHPRYATVLNNYASAMEQAGKYQEAEKLLLEALAIRKECLGEKHSDYYSTMAVLAWIYTLEGKYSKAEPLYIDAANGYKITMGSRHPDYARIINYLGGMYMRAGDYEKAGKFYNEALQLRRDILGTKHPDYIVSVYNMARLCAVSGKNESALSFFVESIDLTNNAVISSFSFLTEKEKELYFATRASVYDDFYSFAFRYSTDYPEITGKVYDTAIRNKGLLLKSSTAMRNAILESGDTAIIRQYAQWVELRKEIDRLNKTEISKRKRDPDQLEVMSREMEKELVRSSQLLGDLESVLKITWKDIQQGLKSDEAAVEFISFTAGKTKDSVLYCALILKPGFSQPLMIPLCYEKDLSELLAASEKKVKVLYGKNSPVAQRLYRMVWAPVAEATGNAKVVYVSPSGWLHKISFSALVRDQNTYLCDVSDIRIQSSTAQLTGSREFLLDRNSSVLIFGGLKYNSPASREELWTYLDGTKVEAMQICKIMQKKVGYIHVYTDTSGTEAHFKKMAEESNWLHISTHGFFFPDPELNTVVAEMQPEVGNVTFRGVRGYGLWQFVNNQNPLMRSGLVFAGANEVWNDEVIIGREDGMLTADEVAVMNLRKCGMVVMSACETGLGEIRGSEGVYGLQRAFKMAGVKYIIMSLWQIPDKETVEFMKILYKKFLKTNDIRMAFNETQKVMREKYEPFYWGAFVLIE